MNLIQLILMVCLIVVGLCLIVPVIGWGVLLVSVIMCIIEILDILFSSDGGWSHEKWSERVSPGGWIYIPGYCAIMAAALLIAGYRI